MLNKEERTMRIEDLPCRYSRLHHAALGLASLILLVGSRAEAQANQRQAREKEVAALLNVEAVGIAQLHFGAKAGDTLEASIEIDGKLRQIVLTPTSVRAPGFTIRVPLPDGSYGTMEPPPAKTYGGVLQGVPGSRVAASLRDDGLFARVIMPDVSERWIEPLSVRDARFGPSDYAVYRGRDILPSNGTCEEVHVDPALLEADASSTEDMSDTKEGGSSYIAEVAVDMDVEFFNDFGSAEDAIDHIEMIFNLMNLQYMRELDIRHDITAIIVRSEEPDPYTSSNSSTLLNQFRNHWNSTQGSVQRDIAHMFTGREIDGSVIGIAYVGAICSSGFGYGLVQPNCCSSLGCKTDLSAHELGHNWSAQHCDCSSWTMNASLQCANRFHPSFTIPGMTSYRNSRSCLTQEAPFACASLAAPVADASFVPTNRYLAVKANNPGQLSAMRVTFQDLPAPFDIANGASMWLGSPKTVSENSGVIDPDQAPGFGSFQTATLTCSPTYLDWSSLGTIQVFSEFIVPGGTYLFQEVDAICPFEGESAYSPPLQLTTHTVWADVVSDCETTPCGPPDGLVNVTTDLVALLDKFSNKSGAPSKVRADLQPETPDGIVGIQEISRMLSAFAGGGYPFAPSGVPCE